MSRTLACFVSPTSPEEYKPQALQQLQAWSTCETNQTCESPCTGRTQPPHVKRRQLWPTLLWNRFLIDRKSKQIGVLSTLAGLHGSRVETCICWHCHTFPTGFCTSGAAYCIIKRGRRVTYIKQTGATQQSAEWAESVYACRKGREGKGDGSSDTAVQQSKILMLHLCVWTATKVTRCYWQYSQSFQQKLITRWSACFRHILHVTSTYVLPYSLAKENIRVKSAACIVFVCLLLAHSYGCSTSHATDDVWAPGGHVKLIIMGCTCVWQACDPSQTAGSLLDLFFFF